MFCKVDNYSPIEKRDMVTIWKQLLLKYKELLQKIGCKDGGNNLLRESFFTSTSFNLIQPPSGWNS